MATGAGKAERGSLAGRLNPSIRSPGGSRVLGGRGGRGHSGSSPGPTPAAHRQPFWAVPPPLTIVDSTGIPDSQGPAAWPPLPRRGTKQERWSQAPPRGVPQTRWAVRMWGTQQRWDNQDQRCQRRHVRLADSGVSWVSTCFHMGFERLWNASRPGNKTSPICRGYLWGGLQGTEQEMHISPHRVPSSLTILEALTPHLPLTLSHSQGPRVHP